MDTKNNNMGTMVSIVQNITTIGTVVLLSTYFFARGYIHSFSLPITVSFSESSYFMISLIADGILPILFSIFTSQFVWIIITICIILFFLKTPLKNLLKYVCGYLERLLNFAPYVQKTLKTVFTYLKKILNCILFCLHKIFYWLDLEKITPLRFNIYFMLLIFIITIILDLKVDFNKEMHKMHKIYEIYSNAFSCKTQDKQLCYILNDIYILIIEVYNSIKSIILLTTLITVIFSIPLFISLFLKKKNVLKNVPMFILTTIISASSSYSLGRNYLPNFIHYPKYREDRETKERRIQIWRGLNSYFYVKCKIFGVSFIEGVGSNGKVFYVGYLDKHKHKNICEPFVSRQRPNKQFVIHFDCFYKNKQKEFSPATECLKIYNYFLVVPKGSLQVCYVNTLNVEIDQEGYTDRILKTSGMKKQVESPSLSIKQQTQLGNYCSTLQKQVSYRPALFCGLNCKEYQEIIDTIINEDHESTDSLRKQVVEQVNKHCPTKFLLYYDDKLKREQLLSMAKWKNIDVKDHFAKCK